MLVQISTALPAIASTPHAGPGGEIPKPPKNFAPHVLVVDDEPLVRWSIGETLRLHGCRITEAGDGQTALASLRWSTAPPDAVILDLKLPDSDDLTLLMGVRRLAPSAAVILMTAFATPEIVEEAKRLGAFTVLDKPFELDQLDELVGRALAGRQAH
jgi:DNA-binding NtrC family response regulator